MALQFNAWRGFADACTALLSMWLTSSRQLLFLDAPFDDRLFARLANSLRDGQWLGAYDKLTLVKGPGYPAFMALTSYVGIPLRLAEQAVYLLGCWLVSRAVCGLSDRRSLGTVTFAVAALNPVLWGGSLARIVREDLYVGLTVVVLGLAMLTFLTRSRPQVRTPQLVSGVFLGLAFGWLWLTREEGMWLVPSLGLVGAYWTVRRWSCRPSTGKSGYAARTVLVMVVPCLAFAAVDLGAAAVNFRHYGVFETNDFRSDEFRAAYGALSRIEHNHWQRLIPIPRDARVRAYEVSPAARELQPFLDGSVGQLWQQVGCSSWPIEPCRDIQAGWFMWALRDSAETANHYHSATSAREFYARLAREVNTACDSGCIACLPPRTGFLPPFRREYLPFIVHNVGRLLAMLADLGGQAPAENRAINTPGIVEEFRRVAKGPWAGQDDAPQGNRLQVVKLRGWAFAPAGVLKARVIRENGDAVGVLVDENAPDIPIALNAEGGVAVRFAGVARCGGHPCQLEVEHDGKQTRFDVATLQPGPLPAADNVRVWLDEVGPVRSTDAPRNLAREGTVLISHVMRSLSVVMLPLSVLAAPVLIALDLRTRRLRAITLVWLALLTAIVARIALLAVLDATSLPAVSTLYLSPAVGLALLFMAGVIGDLVIRLVRSRPVKDALWPVRSPVPPPNPDGC